MNVYKLNLILKEFPFLKEILDDEKGVNNDPINPEYVKIKRVDENLLSCVPCERYWDYNAEGKKFFVVVDKEVKRLDPKIEDHVEGNIMTVPSVGEQLFQKKLNADYIVCFDFIWNSGSIVNAKLTLYKSDKFYYYSYHCGQIDKAARQLKEEIQF